MGERSRRAMDRCSNYVPRHHEIIGTEGDGQHGR